uniref:Holin-X, holin superfamily III n=1 Tax=Candidatus Kentrum sp. FW TaxID=2126338 RepID=A0A450S4C7_9GAMM|nr:MAG: hypothetical protein BECKFW1821B_GA0114236_100123 [Candidatus Kentron sp. FW]
MGKKMHDISSFRSKLWASFLLSTVGGIIAFVSIFSSISSFIGVLDLGHLLAAVIVIGGAILLTVGFTFILARRERGPSHLAKLKNDITAAYLNALEQSTLNPARGKQP